MHFIKKKTYMLVLKKGHVSMNNGILCPLESASRQYTKISARLNETSNICYLLKFRENLVTMKTDDVYD